MRAFAITLALVAVLVILIAATPPGPVGGPRVTLLSLGGVGTNTFQTFTNSLGTGAFADTNLYTTTNAFRGFTNSVGTAAFVSTNQFIQSLNGNGTNTTLDGLAIVSATANIGVAMAGANPTNVVDLNVATATNILNGDLTLLHATNGAAHYEKTHVRVIWAGGSNRTLTWPSGWKTNVHAPPYTTITNGTILKLYITSIGGTGSSADQTNVFISSETYQ